MFFAVPAALWLVGAIAAGRAIGWGPKAFLGFIGGSDRRLSLSRLQAFAWTLVIFGAFVAAMATSSTVGYDSWIKIPDALLELAGIAIGTGVFSSLIASATGEEGNPRITNLRYQTSDWTKQDEWVIEGADFGDRDRRGRVRVRGINIRVRDWTPTAIYIDPVRFKANDVLVVDTSTGKAANLIEFAHDKPQIGNETVNYETMDLFRNDKDPLQPDIMKFQLFGWTVIAIAIYVVVFLSSLSPAIVALPPVDQSIVVLTGVSQSGYLASKALSPGKPQPTS